LSHVRPPQRHAQATSDVCAKGRFGETHSVMFSQVGTGSARASGTAIGRRSASRTPPLSAARGGPGHLPHFSAADTAPPPHRG
jgi:hypothetical protein